VASAGLILDFDGTILDTETSYRQSWREEYERHAVAFDEAGWAAAAGGYGGPDRYAALADLVGASFDVDGCRRRRRARELALLMDCDLRPGIAGWLADAAELDVPVAVASSSPASWVLPHLEHRGLLGRFRAVCTGEQVPAAKPAPDLHRLAAAWLGVPPVACVAVEDSHSGVTAAAAAGCFVVAVPNEVTSGQTLTSDLTATTLAAIRLQDVLRRLPANPERPRRAQ
jgi:beta-phosphoglucomutase-like phosphatase (HAD superfamily)